MFNPALVTLIICLYIGFLFTVALWVERSVSRGRNLFNNAWLYSLALAVYCTAWTYYGSVGKAATNGFLFVLIYTGPTVAIVSWWTVLRKLVRIKNLYRVTSIADFISARYNKSQLVAAIVTVIVLIGNLPYIALQLKAFISTFEIITQTQTGSGNPFFIQSHVGLLMVGLLIVFTILFGVRRLDPTERHQGMMVALSVECIVKLIAFLAAGIFVTYFMFDGFKDILQRIQEAPFMAPILEGHKSVPITTYITYFVVSMSAIMFLPRQFHVEVVENADEKHIRKAMWVFPLYMLLINIFVYPIAMGGLLEGHSIALADSFVLRLPLEHGRPWLGLFVFIGGISAATGMIMISSMTTSTMVTNHLILPLVEWIKSLGILKRNLLKCRWVVVALYILLGYWFEIKIGASYTLVNIGMISFAAAMQFAPSILGGLFWRRGNKAGAMMGLTAGFLIWVYTLLLPSFVKSGWITKSLLENGPFGINFLRPEKLFGITSLDPLSHGVFWCMLFNVGLYCLGSIYFPQSKEEEKIADDFVGILESTRTATPHHGPRQASIGLAEKRSILQDLLLQYLPSYEAELIINNCFKETGLRDKQNISIVELAELNSHIEKTLAGSVGTAAAHRALLSSNFFTTSEAKELTEVYTELLANFKLTPEELISKIDYHQERERLITENSAQLEVKILELEDNIQSRKRAEEQLRLMHNELEDRVKQRTADLVSINEQLRVEILERKLAEQKIQAAHRQLLEIIEFLPDPTFVIDAGKKIIAWNRAIEALTGKPKEEMLGKGDGIYALPFYGKPGLVLIDLVFKRDSEAEKRYIFVEQKGNNFYGEVFAPALYNGKGAYLWVTASPLFDDKGVLIGAIESVRDVTEREETDKQIKKSLKEKEILLKEVHHRVKNNVQVISSLLKLQSRFLKDKEALDILKESQNRIKSMALIHEKFYQSQDLSNIDFKQYTTELAKSLLSNYGIDSSKISLNLDIQDVSLGINLAIPCGLVLNELISNCLKYAFPGDRKGEIRVSMHPVEDNQIELIVSDNGVGMAPDLDLKKVSSLGLQLCTALVENQIGGTIDIDRSSGTKFRIVFKVI